MAKVGTYAALQQLKPIDVSRGTEAIGRGLIEQGEQIRKEGDERKKQQALDDKETEQKVEKINSEYPDVSFDVSLQGNNMLITQEFVKSTYNIANNKPLSQKDKSIKLNNIEKEKKYFLKTVNDFTKKTNEFAEKPDSYSELYPPPIEMYEGIKDGTTKPFIDEKQGVLMIKFGDKEPVPFHSIAVNAMNAKPKLEVTKLENDWSTIIADQTVTDAKKGLTGRGLFNAQKAYDDLDEQTKLELSLDYNRSAWLDKDGKIDRSKLKDKEFTELMIKTAKDEWVNRMSIRAGFAKPTTSGGGDSGGSTTKSDNRAVHDLNDPTKVVTIKKTDDLFEDFSEVDFKDPLTVKIVSETNADLKHRNKTGKGNVRYGNINNLGGYNIQLDWQSGKKGGISGKQTIKNIFFRKDNNGIPTEPYITIKQPIVGENNDGNTTTYVSIGYKEVIVPLKGKFKNAILNAIPNFGKQETELNKWLAKGGGVLPSEIMTYKKGDAENAENNRLEEY